RHCQRADGSWEYHFGAGGSYRHSMTCAGLLALAVGRGVRREQSGPLGKDPMVEKGFAYLARVVGGPARRTTPGSGPVLKADGWGDLYFLWALERLAVVYDLREIGGSAWYPWGVGLLLPTQNEDGSWSEAYPGAVDTSFALLFLRRGNVAPDLTMKLKS